MEEHDVVEGVLVVALEVLPTVVEVGPGLEYQVLNLVVILIVVLLQLCLDFWINKQTIKIEAGVMLNFF